MLFVAFCGGMTVDALLRAYGPPKPAASATPTAASASTWAAPTVSAPPKPEVRVTSNVDAASAIAPGPPGSAAPSSPVPSASTASTALRVPIDGVNVESFKGGFAEARTGHPHEAVDILIARGTPVHAVQDGSIAKLFFSRYGGNTIYEFDPDGRLCYYYAHLDRYEDGLRDGQHVAQGEVIGYVGTSGNAPPNTPHLHFAVFELTAARHWWQGRALDPYLVFKDSRN
jgi:peptidoglycan LD-endopeptidase LytH